MSGFGADGIDSADSADSTDKLGKYITQADRVQKPPRPRWGPGATALVRGLEGPP